MLAAIFALKENRRGWVFPRNLCGKIYAAT